MKNKSSERGSVLVAVLWLLAMLAIFSWSVARQASQELLFSQWLRDRVMGRSLTRAAVQRAIFELQQDKFKIFDALNENWASNPDAFQNGNMGTGFFSVSCAHDKEILFGLCDESARISLNKADEELLALLFQTVLPSMGKEKAVQTARAVIDWRDKDVNPLDQGAESDYYEGAKKPYRARNGDFQSVEELNMVKGMTPELFRKVKPFVTVYSEGRVNFNTASKTVLKSLGLSDALAEKVLQFRRGADKQLGTQDDEVFQDVSQITPVLSAAMHFSGEEYEQIANPAAKGWMTVTSRVFRIHAKGLLNRQSRKTDTLVTCVVKRDGSILYWKEGEEA